MTKYLVHFGVKGQKWGVLRKRDKGSRGSSPSDKKLSRKEKDIAKARRIRTAAETDRALDMKEIETFFNQGRISRNEYNKQKREVQEYYARALKTSARDIQEERRSVGMAIAGITLCYLGARVLTRVGH